MICGSDLGHEVCARPIPRTSSGLQRVFSQENLFSVKRSEFSKIGDLLNIHIHWKIFVSFSYFFLCQPRKKPVINQKCFTWNSTFLLRGQVNQYPGCLLSYSFLHGTARRAKKARMSHSKTGAKNYSACCRILSRINTDTPTLPVSRELRWHLFIWQSSLFLPRMFI